MQILLKLKYWHNPKKVVAKGWWRTQLIGNDLDTIECIWKNQKEEKFNAPIAWYAWALKSMSNNFVHLCHPTMNPTTIDV
jgi:hypothetical protein